MSILTPEFFQSTKPGPGSLVREVIYTSCTYATMSMSVCLSVCLWQKCAWRKCIGTLQLIYVSNSDPNLPRIVVAVHAGASYL